MSTPQPAAGALAVERLTLHVPAMSEEEARRLVQLVAQALRRWPAAPAAAGRIASVTARVEQTEQQPGRPADTAALADRIAEAVLAEALRELD